MPLRVPESDDAEELKRMIQRHDDDACEFVEDRCERCEERFSRKFRKRHEKKCPLYECECPTLKCGTVLKKEPNGFARRHSVRKIVGRLSVRTKNLGAVRPRNQSRRRKRSTRTREKLREPSVHGDPKITPKISVLEHEHVRIEKQLHEHLQANNRNHEKLKRFSEDGVEVDENEFRSRRDEVKSCGAVVREGTKR